MIQYEQDGQFRAIQCDATGCAAVNPPVIDPSLNKGLIGLGWYCAGGKHLCPDHAHILAGK